MEPSNFQQISFEPQGPKSSKSPSFFLLPFLVLIILAGGTIGALATKIWDPVWNPFREKPEKVIAKMMREMTKVKSYEGETTLNFEFQGEKEKVNLDISINTKEDAFNPENRTSENKIKLAILTQEEEDQIKTNLEAEAIGQNERLYFKINEFPTFLSEEDEEVGAFLESLRNKWIEVTDESLIELMKEISGEEFGEEFEAQIRKEIEKRKEVEKNLRGKIERIITEKNFFIPKKVLPDEKIKGVPTYHYLTTLNTSVLSQALMEIVDLYLDELSKEDLMKDSSFGSELPLAKGMIKGMLKEILDSFWKNIGEIEVELWIGKRDYLLYRLKVEKTANLENFIPEEKGKISIKFDSTMFAFNRPMKIETPSNTTDIKEILLPILRTIKSEMETTRKIAEDANIQSSLLHIRTLARVIEIEKGSYKELCANGVLNVKNEDLKRLQERIREKQGGTLRLSCVSAKDSFCIIADLNEGGAYCIDSNLSAEEVEEGAKCLGRGTKNDPFRCPPSLFPEREIFPKDNSSFFGASLLEGLEKFLSKKQSEN